MTKKVSEFRIEPSLDICFRVESNCQASGSIQAKISFWHNNVKIDNIEAGFKEFEHCFSSNSFDVENDLIKLHINGDPWSTYGVRFKNIFRSVIFDAEMYLRLAFLLCTSMKIKFLLEKTTTCQNFS